MLSPVAIAVPTFTVAEQFASAAAAMLSGQVIAAVPPCSSTVMVKLQEPPPVSEVALTAVVPTGKKEPEAGVELTDPQSPEVIGGS